MTILSRSLSFAAVVGTVLVAAPPAAAQDTLRLRSPLLESVPGRKVAQESYDVIRLKSGEVLVGRILRESTAGIVFRQADGETRLVSYDEVDDIQTTGSAPANVPAPQTAPASPASPTPPATLSPSDERLRATLIDERAKLIDQRDSIRLLGSSLLIVTGVVVMVAALVWPNLADVDRTAILISGGLIGALGLGAVVFKVAARNRLDRRIKDVNRKLNALGRHQRDGYEVMLLAATHW